MSIKPSSVFKQCILKISASTQAAWLLVIVSSMLGSACQMQGAKTPAPVVSLPIKAEHIPEYHVVKHGESLYTVAWIYDLDVAKLERLNHLTSPDYIREGQKVYLKRQAPNTKPTLQAKNAYPKQSYPTQQPTLQVMPAEPTRNAASTAKAPENINKRQENQSGQSNWLKPAEGKITKPFSTQKHDYHKGIDITGRLNDPIYAAKSGKVVYSGEGLRGYGKLIIIKHDETFLSAYAHNHTLLVKEGDQIQQGAQIAKMGNTDSPSVKLHFQIRKNGQPVDPLPYLNQKN